MLFEQLFIRAIADHLALQSRFEYSVLIKGGHLFGIGALSAHSLRGIEMSIGHFSLLGPTAMLRIKA